MSNVQSFGLGGGGGSSNVEFLTGNNGGPVPADSMHNINFVGGSGVVVDGDPLTNTLTISASGAEFTVGSFQTTPNDNGLILIGSALSVTQADATHPGSLSAGPSLQTIGGAKLFNTSVESPLFLVDGATSGVATIQAQDTFTSYNFNLPTTAGTSGYFLTSAGGGSSAMTWTNISGSGGVTTIDGDSGSATPTSGIITITGGTSGAIFTGSGSTLTESFNFLSLPTTSSTNGQIKINSIQVLQAFGTNNIFLGRAGNFTLTTGSAVSNVGIGSLSLSSLTTGSINTALGVASAQNITTGISNLFLGATSGLHVTTANENTGIGTNAFNTTGFNGSNNIGIGYSVGTQYIGSESSNILIGNIGINGENNVLRLGTQGSSAGQQNACYIAGVLGVTTSNSEMVTINSSTGQLGVATIPAAAIDEIDGDSGSITGSIVTIYADHASVGSGSSVLFTNSGTTSTLSVTDANFNTLIGNSTGNLSLGGNNNVGLGYQVLTALTSGFENVAIGNQALNSGQQVISSVAIGYQALFNSVDDSSNIAIGTQALYACQGSSFNVAIGNAALNTSVADVGNLAIGYNSLLVLNGGDFNTALGTQTLASCNTGRGNVAIGYQSMYNDTSGSANTAIGTNSLFSNTTSDNNVAIGYSSLYSLNGGVENVAIGTNALYTSVTDNGNTAIGFEALYLCNGGTANTAIGAGALNVLTTGNDNVAIGSAALVALTTGSSCVALGNAALRNCTTDTDNIAIGDSCMYSVNGGSQNIAIGSDAMYNANTASGNIAIGYFALVGCASGIFNISLGDSSGQNYAGSESSNILLNSLGVLGESNALRIGAGTGGGSGQLASAYICGINGVNVSSSTVTVVSMTSGSDQLGTVNLVAGTGVTITPTANTITIAASSSALSYTNVDHAASPYTVLPGDYYISVDCSAGAVTLLFPNAPTVNETWIVKDRTGSSATNNITITTPGGAVTFDGSTTYVLNTAYESVNLIANATPTYELF